MKLMIDSHVHKEKSQNILKQEKIKQKQDLSKKVEFMNVLIVVIVHIKASVQKLREIDKSDLIKNYGN